MSNICASLHEVLAATASFSNFWLGYIIQSFDRRSGISLLVPPLACSLFLLKETCHNVNIDWLLMLAHPLVGVLYLHEGVIWDNYPPALLVCIKELFFHVFSLIVHLFLPPVFLFWFSTITYNAVPGIVIGAWNNSTTKASRMGMIFLFSWSVDTNLIYSWSLFPRSASTLLVFAFSSIFNCFKLLFEGMPLIDITVLCLKYNKS